MPQPSSASRTQRKVGTPAPLTAYAGDGAVSTVLFFLGRSVGNSCHRLLFVACFLFGIRLLGEDAIHHASDVLGSSVFAGCFTSQFGEGLDVQL